MKSTRRMGWSRTWFKNWLSNFCGNLSGTSIVLLFGVFGVLCLGAGSVGIRAGASGGGADDWPSYGHDPGGMRYSPLTEINRQNVSQLKVAWTFHTGDISDGKGSGDAVDLRPRLFWWMGPFTSRPLSIAW